MLLSGVDLEQNLGGGQCDKGANDQNIGGVNVTKVPIIDQIDKFILKKMKKEKQGKNRSARKIFGGIPGPSPLSSLYPPVSSMNVLFEGIMFSMSAKM